MKRDGIRIENEACRSYVNMEQTGNMWELQEQDPQLHVYFTESVMGVRLSFFLCIEGIEEKEELERIMLLKPDYIQGFYYGRPVSLSVFMESYEI